MYAYNKVKVNWFVGDVRKVSETPEVGCASIAMTWLFGRMRLDTLILSFVDIHTLQRSTFEWGSRRFACWSGGLFCWAACAGPSVCPQGACSAGVDFVSLGLAPPVRVPRVLLWRCTLPCGATSGAQVVCLFAVSSLAQGGAVNGFVYDLP